MAGRASCFGSYLAMQTDSMSQSARWIYALKPASWPKVLLPAILGQAAGIATTGRVRFGAVVFGLLWTIAHVSFVVLVNDWGDRDVDAIKRRMFPRGCSPKTIPDRILPARALLVGGLVACAVALVLALAAGPLLHRPLLFPLALLAALVFAAYTLPPLKLNYRGGGELLEMAGVGVLLPVIHAYAQSGELVPPWLRAVMPGVATLALASAIASGLADESSDRVGGKTTFVTTFGNAAARGTVEGLLGAASVLLITMLLFRDAPPPWSILPAAILVLVFQLRLVERSAQATTDAFGAQSAYKRELHRGIWWPTVCLAVSLIVARFARGFEGATP